MGSWRITFNEYHIPVRHSKREGNLLLGMAYLHAKAGRREWAQTYSGKLSDYDVVNLMQVCPHCDEGHPCFVEGIHHEMGHRLRRWRCTGCDGTWLEPILPEVHPFPAEEGDRPWEVKGGLTQDEFELRIRERRSRCRTPGKSWK